MKNIKINALLLLVLAALLHSSQVFAHTYIGSLGTFAQPADPNVNPAAGNTDLYQVDCFTDATEPSQAPTHELYIGVINYSATAGALSAQAYRKATTYLQPITVNTTDLIGGDTTPSPDTWLQNPASVPDGDATYYVAVNHTNRVVSNYQLTFHCLDAQGVHTGTDISVLQNQ